VFVINLCAQLDCRTQSQCRKIIFILLTKTFVFDVFISACASSSFTKVSFFEHGQTGDECLILASEIKTESSDSLYACVMYAWI